MRPAASSPRWQGAALALLVAALWMIARPYRGVRHDGLLYLGQVFHRLMPDRFASDLFFAFGSQDRWSVFSPLMAPLVARFGVAASVMAVLVACHVLFMAGCWLLVREWPSRTLRWAAMVAVVVLPHTYGGLGAFGFAEPFLTARSLAEPLVLFSLWQLMRGRLAPALAFMAVAGVCHPLVALPGLVVGWFFLLQQDRRWAWALATVAVPAVLGLAGIAPFDALWRRFDPAWWDAIHISDAHAFVADYRMLDIAPALFDVLALLLYVATHRTEGLARLARATLLATLALTILWGLGADVLHDVLLTQLQLWRVYWLLHLLALLVLPPVAVHYARKGWVGLWCVAALAAAGLGVMSNWPTGWLLVAWALAALAADHFKAAVSPFLAKAAAAASVAMIVFVSYRVAATTFAAVLQRPDRFDDAGLSLVVLGLPAVGVAIGALVAWLLLASGRARQAAGVALLLALLAFGVTRYDQRSTWQRYLEASDHPRPFDDVLPANASVYWDDGLEVPWMLAQRGSFHSHDQGAGLLFNHGTALEFFRRRDVLAGMQFQENVCRTIHALTRPRGTPPTECAPSPAVLAEVCHATPHPDWVVLDNPMPASVPMRAEWHLDLPGPRSEHRSYHLYACSALH